MLDRLYTSLQLQHLDLHAVVDMLILAFVIYQLLLLIRGTRSANMIIALVVLVGLYVVTSPELIGLNAVNTVLGACSSTARNPPRRSAMTKEPTQPEATTMPSPGRIHWELLYPRMRSAGSPEPMR